MLDVSLCVLVCFWCDPGVILVCFWCGVSLLYISCYCVAICPRQLLFCCRRVAGALASTTSKRMTTRGEGRGPAMAIRSVVRSFAKLKSVVALIRKTLMELTLTIGSGHEWPSDQTIWVDQSFSYISHLSKIIVHLNFFRSIIFI